MSSIRSDNKIHEASCVIAESNRQAAVASAGSSAAAVKAALRNVRCWVPAQPVDATQALNLSAGVSNCKVSRGRSLS
jgi:hypothetical protein